MNQLSDKDLELALECRLFQTPYISQERLARFLEKRDAEHQQSYTPITPEQAAELAKSFPNTKQEMGCVYKCFNRAELAAFANLVLEQQPNSEAIALVKLMTEYHPYQDEGAIGFIDIAQTVVLFAPIQLGTKLFTHVPSLSAKSVPEPLQTRVAPWMKACFGEKISADKLERGDRFLEEALELLQSGDYPKERIPALVEYVYNRDKGEPSQEVGGVMITLAAYCLAHELNMHDAGEIELARILQPEIIEKIRAKQAAKPNGSVLPIAAPQPPQVEDRVRELESLLNEINNWLVCAAIATPADMMQSAPIFQKRIDAAMKEPNTLDRLY